MMGSPPGEPGRKRNEGPQHEVTIAKPFAVSKFEVTFADWEACNRSSGDRCWYPELRNVGLGKPKRDEGWGMGKRPLINVGFEKFYTYLIWLKERTGKQYRFLSEAEWEYAARAGTSTPYPIGTSITLQQARFGAKPWDSNAKTIEVGSFAPNAFGLYDMNGNVWEWVEDCWHDTYAGAPKDGSAWIKTDGPSWEKCMRVLRGGGWSSDAAFLRSAYRSRFSDFDSMNYYGFRIARPLD